MSGIEIEVKGVTRVYTRGGESLRVLDGFDMKMEGGTFYSLMGPSGSGKSTLLNIIGGLDVPDSGSVQVGTEFVTELSGADLSSWRAEHVGFVFQSFNLIPVLSAIENVELALLLAPLSRSERRKHAENALGLVGLGDRMKHKPNQLSGGQQQRVAIARAVATDPDVILADEPTGDLDRDSGDAVLDLLVQLNRELGKTILMVTHDPVAAARSDVIVNLDKGRLGHLEDNRKAGV